MWCKNLTYSLVSSSCQNFQSLKIFYEHFICLNGGKYMAMDHIAHLRNQFKSMNTFEQSHTYIIKNWSSSSGGEDF